MVYQSMKMSMKVLLKSPLLLLLFIIITFFAIVNTKIGNKLAYFYIGDRISVKSKLDVKVLSLIFINILILPENC